ncbi:MAG: PAS domain S-box protein [Haloarculaceae archaeon]
MDADRDLNVDDRRFFEQLVEQMDDAVLFADREGTIRYWNESAERVFGFDAEEAVGSPMDLIIPERFREAHWAGYERAMGAGESPYGPGELLSVPARHAEDERISAELTITAIRDAEGDLAGLAAVCREVTERFEREREREQRIEELEAKVEELSE